MGGSAVERWVPGYAAARHYRRAWLRPDLAAGIVLAALLVPQGMAYAQLAGLPPITGLYTTVTALAAYAVFGPSRRMVLGPDSALAPLIAAAVLPLAAGDTREAVALASMLALLTGALCVLAGLGGLGTITELLSKPVRVGYLNGLALVMLAGQVPVVFGFTVEADNVFGQVAEFLRRVTEDTSLPTLAVGGTAVVAMALLSWRATKVPGALLAVVIGTVVVAAFDLTAEGVEVVGSIPEGFPSPSLPSVGLDDMGTLAVAAVGIALVSFADTSALSAGMRKEGGFTDDPNHEAIGLGAANLLTGFFRGFPISASTTRTVVATSMGSRTQLTGLVGAALVLLIVVGGGTVVEQLPITILAAIIVMAAVALLDLDTVRWMLRVRRSEFLLSVAATLGVAVFGVFEGIAVAVGLSVATFVWRLWRPHDAVLGRVEFRKGYHDVERHPEADRIPGLVVFRFDAPLFFANAEHFRRRVDEVLVHEPEPVDWLLLAAEPVTDVDTTGAEVLGTLLDDLEERGVTLAMAEMKGPVKDRLHRYGLYDRIGDDHFYPTLGTAIDGYLEATGIVWVDWTDRRDREDR